MRFEVSIVIVNYNVCDLLRNCLKSIVDQDVAAEIIVVDNASSDKSVQMVREEFSLVHLIVNEHNSGFSAANNQGMDNSTAARILLLNPDTEMEPGSLRKILDFGKAQGPHTIFGPQLLNSDGSLQKSAWKKPSFWDMFCEALFLHKLFAVSEYTDEKFQSEFQAGMLSGAAIMLTRELYLRVGGLDPRLFWMEDADFATRVSKSGGKVIYYPEAKIIHHSGQSSKRNLKTAISNQLISKLKYYKKHQGTFVMLVASLFCFFHIISRLFIFVLAAPFAQSAAEKAGAYLYTAGKFLRYLFTGDQRVT